jgi:hypothetical protein
MCKNFPIKERLKFQFRFESFALFNHSNFANPSATFGTSSFGNITAKRQCPGDPEYSVWGDVDILSGQTAWRAARKGRFTEPARAIERSRHLLPPLPFKQDNSRGDGHVERGDFARHGDAYQDVAVVADLLVQSLAFAA